MPWAPPRFVVYDIPNENILMFDEDNDELTDDDLKNNKIFMSWGQAEAIRKAKGLPMPSPPPPGGIKVSSELEWETNIEENKQ